LRLTDGGLETYLGNVVSLLERYGLDLDGGASAPSIDQTGVARRLALRARLPSEGPVRAVVEIRETWIADGQGGFERSEYVYDLIDHEQDFRRAYHLHDAEWFQRRLLVVVHEHCERPIGHVDCEHYVGTPLKDAYAGVVALVDAWTSDPPDCGDLRCLE
jgi:hypothetical protein